jgi:hypothetical protein
MLYTDPGSGALLWQVLAAGAVGALFYVRKFFGLFRGNARENSDGGKPVKQD